MTAAASTGSLLVAGGHVLSQFDPAEGDPLPAQQWWSWVDPVNQRPGN